EGAAPVQALAGEHARLVAVGQALVLAEQEADLAGAHADVTGGDVRVLAHVAVQLGHERLAEPHDLAVAAAVRVEVGAALAAADGQAGQRVLEDLLEAEELHDAEVHRGMEPQAALVRAERGVVLDAEAAVDLHGALVIDPGDTEDDLPLRLAQPHQDAVVLVLGVPGLDDLERLEHLPDSLMELGFSGVAVENLVVGRLERRVEHRGPFRGPGAPESRGSPRRRRSRRGPGYADTRREGTERSTSEHADPCRADTQWFCAE